MTPSPGPAELRDRQDAMHAAGLEGADGGAVVDLRAAPARPTAKQATKKTRHFGGSELG